MIEARHLSKLYSRGLYALRDLSLTVEKGEFVFLTGPSGAGKSTFLRLLLRQDLPSEGGLVVNGRNLATLKRHEVQEYRRGLGFIFQDFKLIPTRTVFENITFVPEVLGVPANQRGRRIHWRTMNASSIAMAAEAPTMRASQRSRRVRAPRSRGLPPSPGRFGTEDRG